MDERTPYDQRTQLDSAQALERLKEGNARFLAGQARFPTVQKEVLASLARGQYPFATILGCSDSRAPPELLFDASFGELFVIRVAGNLLGTATAGSLQYASVHIGTPLFVVLGHEGCGAVQAAIEERIHGVTHRSRIALMLKELHPALDALDPGLDEAAMLHCAVEANVRYTVRSILDSPEVQARIAVGFDRQVIGAVYDLATGTVRFLD